FILSRHIIGDTVYTRDCKGVLVSRGVLGRIFYIIAILCIAGDALGIAEHGEQALDVLGGGTSST
ncbi:MAG: hypothetical protein D6712_06600, partial [Chloroflexi bacterium]